MIFLQSNMFGALTPIMPLLLILPVFYFFMIRPQMKRQKDQNTFADNLEKGRDVVTASGIIGKIRSIEGNVVSLEIANNTFIKILKSSISKEMSEAFAAKDGK